jgi:hypothetical protein
MIGSSKILTVSYGTFSCTLEGFDDSFSTMKAIAEYFRGLAADDRYFGAEPPTPDADMLARIAERETSRRVEARTDDSGTGIVLRASALSGAEIAEAAETTEAAEATAEAQVEAEKVAEADRIAEAAEAAQVAEAAEAAEAAQVAEAAKAAEAAQVAEAAKAAEAAQVAEAATEIEAATDDTSLSFDDMAPTPTPEAVPAHPDSESVAAKLQRIRAVVGSGVAVAPIADDFAEDQHAREDTVQLDDVAAAASIEVEAPVADSFEADVSEFNEMEMQQDNVAEDALDVATDVNDEVASDADILSNIAGASAPAVAKPAVRARIVRLRKDATQTETALLAEPEASAAPASDDDLVSNILGADSVVSEEFAEEVGVLSEVEEHDGIASTLEALADDVLEEDAFEEEMGIAALDGAEELMGSDAKEDTASNLSPEDEAALLEELAEVEAELGDDHAEEFDTVENFEEDLSAELAQIDDAPQRLGRSVLPETDDAAMSRIMSQTDEALSEPEGSRRRNAIGQLKAAVAATEAARQLGDQDTRKAETETAFREDLDEAVRPARPGRPARPTRPEVSEENRTARPRPSPLKLVASQRVDAPQRVENEAPVQPRRVAVVEEAASSDAGSFAEFAEEMGASELPDLLEAAAAYTAFVEGVEDFSRPQIMKKVQLTSEQAFTREDGLRSFGTLLRQGRISKVRNGRFQISEQTRFRPEQRAS